MKRIFTFLLSIILLCNLHVTATASATVKNEVSKEAFYGATVAESTEVDTLAIEYLYKARRVSNQVDSPPCSGNTLEPA